MQRWSRARRKTERLIDFDGSSAAPRAETVPILASLLPASFQLGFTIIRAPVWPTRLLWGTKDPRHRFARRQWLLATILLILSFLSCFYHLSLCSFLLSQFLHVYMSRSRKSARKGNSNASERETKIIRLCNFTHQSWCCIKIRIIKVSILERNENHHVWM